MKIVQKIFNRKQQKQNFDCGLTQAKIDEIKNVPDDPKLCTAAMNRHAFEDKDKKILDTLNGVRGVYTDDTQRQILEPAEVVASRINAPEDLDEILGNHSENQKADLQKQHEVCQLKIAQYQEEVIQAELEAIKQACESLPEEAVQIFKDVLIKAEELNAAIKKALKLDSILASKGVTADKRPQKYQVIPYWNLLVFGGNNQASLTWVLNNQKKLWEKKENE